jgi:hypothetical protein
MTAWVRVRQVSLGGQEGRRVVGGILDADNAKLGQATDEHRLAVDVPTAVAQLQSATPRSMIVKFRIGQ